MLPIIKTMTNKEYITKSLHNLGVDADDIDIIIVKSDIKPDAPADTKACDIAVYNRFTVILGSMMQNVSEGGYSVSWNMDAVKMYYTSLCNELGVENVLVGKQKVRNRSYMW